MRDLGTLGGRDAGPAGGCVNERSGLVAGGSDTNSTPNPVTGVPTMDPFLWENGTMTDLGTLGGTLGAATCANNRGQVAGQSDLAGDLTFHPFLWTKPGPMQDLGTLGGNFGAVNWVNDAGEVVGWATNEGDQALFAFLWKNGVMTNLGSVDGDSCSVALAVNSRGQVVGQSFSCGTGPGPHAFLWEDGGPMIDLNTFIPPGSGLILTEASNINDRGEIAGLGSLANGDRHTFLLIPCGEGEEGCQGENTIGAAQNSSAPATQQPTAATPANAALSDRPATMLDRLRSRWGQRYHSPGVETGPTN